MSAVTPDVRALVESVRVGAPATVNEHGHPRQSIVYFAPKGDRLLIRTDAARWKTRDVLRTRWASVCVHGDQPPYPSATLAGPAQILTNGIGPDTALAPSERSQNCCPSPLDPMRCIRAERGGRSLVTAPAGLSVAADT
jgi:pyridoxamine 5'-phosphate oxidase-like protein